MKKSLFILLLFCTITSLAQKVLKGKVVDENEAAIPGASVFLANTSVGTTANSNGEFELSIPQGRYDLIVSSIGFETYNVTITANALQDFMTIKLNPKVKELEAVVLEPVEKDGWEKWGKFFIENFIGTSDFAKHCTIVNYKVIKFRNSKKNNELTAFATEPLIIENRSLGYTIRYQLETFSYNFKMNYLAYEGYPFFEPMEGNYRKQKIWKSNRADAYYGSMMHFMRSLYRNKMMEEGFVVRHLKKITNEEKERVKMAYKAGMKTEVKNGVTYVTNILPKDTQDYYSFVMRQANEFEIIGKDILPGDSIAYAVDNVTAGLAFNDYLLILYKNKQAPAAYWQGYRDRGTSMLSQLVLINQKPVEVQANGSYFKPLDLMSLGYWSWSEKVGTMLPFDYKPETK